MCRILHLTQIESLHHLMVEFPLLAGWVRVGELCQTEPVNRFEHAYLILSTDSRLPDTSCRQVQYALFWSVDRLPSYAWLHLPTVVPTATFWNEVWIFEFWTFASTCRQLGSCLVEPTEGLSLLALACRLVDFCLFWGCRQVWSCKVQTCFGSIPRQNSNLNID